MGRSPHHDTVTGFDPMRPVAQDHVAAALDDEDQLKHVAMMQYRRDGFPITWTIWFVRHRVPGDEARRGIV